jgi:signal transduction histidine kinase
VLLRNERASTEVARLRAVAAVHDERLRMARDLHDSLTKNLHGIWLLSRTMDAALGRGDVESARPTAVAIADTARDLAAQSRTVIHGLRAEPGRTLEEDLRSAVERGAAGHDLVIDLRVFDPPEPSRNAREELLAVASEALHNSVKHAGAHRVEITLGADGGDLGLVVADDGRGFSPPDAGQLAGSGHYGLAGMRERAARVGGLLRVDSGPGRGTRVSMTVPVRRPERRAGRAEGARGGHG